MVGLSDPWLVSRLRRGDEEAYRELVRRFHAGVYGYLRQMGADAALAEDLTQETYVRVWQGIDTLRRPASLRSWLLTIARNEYLQVWRRKRPVLDGTGEPPDPPDPSPGALDLLVEGDRDARLRRLVSALEAPFGEAIVLHYFQGLSLRQVAAVQGIPVGTAKSRVHHALDRLRTCLQEEGVSHVRPGA
jgi:RNA polymerase sigma-70 factor (ECF subfamily)